LSDLAWNILGLAFILFVVVGPLLLVLLIGITNDDET
jgi:hypothetical protein